MLFSYHSLPDLEKSLLSSECDSEIEFPPPPHQIREYICWKDIRYIFYLLFLFMIILFLIFIAFIITIYTSKK